MAMTPGDIESRAFRTVRKGYAPEEVRGFLHEIASSIAAQPRPELVQVGAEVANVLESAHRTASEIEANARARAAEIIAEAEATVAAQRGDIQRIKTQAEVELTNARAESKRMRSEAEAFATQHRTSAEQTRMEADSFAEAEQARIKQLWASLNSETTTRKGEAEDYAKQVRAEADEAARILRAEAEERAARITAETDEAVRRVREQTEKDAQELVEHAEERASTMVAEAEASASRLLDTAKVRAHEEEVAAQERAQERSTEILNQAQERLDLIISTERRTHERLLAALAEVQTAVELVGGVPERTIVSPPDDDTSGQPATPRPARTQFDQFAPVTETESPAVDPADRDSLSQMVGDAVGQALRPFQQGTGS
ncbi:MAG TPA: DivIVA domain-containing protein [Acidimicrobiales bacterium]|nr:DivIVA domain-containing protein [Acidimicrobiales bacterium]